MILIPVGQVNLYDYLLLDLLELIHCVVLIGSSKKERFLDSTQCNCC